MKGGVWAYEGMSYEEWKWKIDPKGFTRLPVHLPSSGSCPFLHKPPQKTVSNYFDDILFEISMMGAKLAPKHHYLLTLASPRSIFLRLRAAGHLVYTPDFSPSSYLVPFILKALKSGRRPCLIQLKADRCDTTRPLSPFF